MNNFEQYLTQFLVEMGPAARKYRKALRKSQAHTKNVASKVSPAAWPDSRAEADSITLQVDADAAKNEVPQKPNRVRSRGLQTPYFDDRAASFLYKRAKSDDEHAPKARKLADRHARAATRKRNAQANLNRKKLGR